jgi:hypothetical protein
MKKTGFLLTALIVLIGMISDNSYADLAEMTETQMRNTTAQAGIALTATDRIIFDSEIGSISYGDEDGTDGTPGYLSMNNIVMKGYADLHNPVTVGVTTKTDYFSEIALTGIDISFDRAEIHMDKFEIESITVGSAPGQGKSFGSFRMTDYHATISGNVRITSH